MWKIKLPGDSRRGDYDQRNPKPRPTHCPPNSSPPSTSLLIHVGFCVDSVSGGAHGRQPAVSSQAQRAGQGLRRKLERAAMLPVPFDGRLRGLRLGLDHCAQEIRGQLLFRRVSDGVPTKVPTHPPRTAHQQVGCVPGHRSVLRSPQAVRHIHVVLRPGLQHHLWTVARHGGG